MKLPIVLVFGLDGTTALGIIRSLYKYAYIIGLNYKSGRGIASYSNRINKLIYYNRELIPSEITNIINNIRTNITIYPTTDDAIKIIMTIKENLKYVNKNKLLLNKDILNIFDKDQVKSFAKRNGLNIPKTFEINKIKNNNLPIIVKPKNSLKHSKNDFIIIRTIKELIKHKYTINNRDFYCEEFIDSDNNMYEVLTGKDYHNRVLSPCIIKKIRQSPPVYGSSSYIKTVKNIYLFKMIHNLIEKLPFTGLLDIELIYSERTRKFYFIEINFRAGAPIFLATSAGLNLPLMCLTNNNKYQCIYNTFWINDETDSANFKNKIVYIIFLVKSVILKKNFAIFDPLDLRPFFEMVVKKFK